MVSVGIAAEAMWFGNAEGGASDERALLMLLGMLQQNASLTFIYDTASE